MFCGRAFFLSCLLRFCESYFRNDVNITCNADSFYFTYSLVWAIVSIFIYLILFPVSYYLHVSICSDVIYPFLLLKLVELLVLWNYQKRINSIFEKPFNENSFSKLYYFSYLFQVRFQHHNIFVLDVSFLFWHRQSYRKGKFKYFHFFLIIVKVIFIGLLPLAYTQNRMNKVNCLSSVVILLLLSLSLGVEHLRFRDHLLSGKKPRQTASFSLINCSLDATKVSTNQE
jgi:hypothetical protein